MFGRPLPSAPPQPTTTDRAAWVAFERDHAAFMEAKRIIEEYNLHMDGLTYSLQGYKTLEGELPARTIDEYLLCKRLYALAYKDKS